MITLDDEDLWKSAWAYKDHGKSWDAVHNRKHPPGFRWLHESWGTNWRMTEMQAAIGRIQLRRMPQWHEARRRNAMRLADGLANLDGLRIPLPDDGVEHAWYKFYGFVRQDALKSGWNRDRIMNEIVAAGVPCYSGSCPEVYREKAFADTDFAPPQRLPTAMALGDTSLMFLVHPTLTDDQLEKTVEIARSVLKHAVR